MTETGRVEGTVGERSTSARPAPARILALDLSLTASGCVCWKCGISTISFKKLTGPERLVSIREAVLSHVHEHRPDIVVIENYVFSSHQAAPQGELGGVIRVALYDVGVPYVLIPPKSLKKFITDKGNANKDEMIAATIRRYPEFTGTTNNESDAYGLGVMAKSHYWPEERDGLAAFQQKVLDTVEWPDLEVMP